MTPINFDSYGKVWFHRQLLDSRVWRSHNLTRVFTWCLLRANYRAVSVSVTTGRSTTIVDLSPGQFVFGRYEAAKELFMKPTTARNCIKKLVIMGNLATEPATHYTIITVCNWGTYQHREPTSGHLSGQPKANQRPTKGQPKATDNKEEKEKKEKKKSEYAPHRDYMDSWNEMATAHGRPVIIRTSGKRQQQIRSRHAEPGFAEAWPTILEKIPKSSLLMGKDGGWAVTFDWIFKNSDNWLKISEGNYDGKADDAKKKAAELIAKAGKDEV